jgi:hypothetical protein
MATINGTQSITVNSVARSYVEAVHSAYAKQLAAGNTRVKRATITDGESLLRYSHDTTNIKGIERHVVSIEDRLTTDGESTIARIAVTLTVPETGAQDTSAKLLAAGFLTWLNDSGRIEDLLNSIL